MDKRFHVLLFGGQHMYTAWPADFVDAAEQGLAEGGDLKKSCIGIQIQSHSKCFLTPYWDSST